LAKTWEFTDPGTYVVYLRQGIHWQNIPPANGREFTADDVVYHYGREYGLGAGFTKPSPYNLSAYAAWANCISVTATDKYTVVFKWKTPNPEYIMENMQSNTYTNLIECPDAVKQWGDVTDWRHAIGTGPWILKDFVSGSSATMVKNPDYWGYDERYPQNKLPYIDTFKILIMTDTATALAAMRSGKIDAMHPLSVQQAQSMQKTNPEILQITVPASGAEALNMRIDKTPFNDIRVRKAMQMAINLPDIAKNYYLGAVDPIPQVLTSSYMNGWGFPYDQWPQELKDEYAYNPTGAKQLLADAGYATGFKTNIVADNSGDMNLLQIVKSYFAAINIDMEIRTLDPTSWTSFVMTNHSQDAMAYRSGFAAGTTFDFIRVLNRYQTGNSGNFSMVSDSVFDSYYPAAIAATTVDQVKQIIKNANEEAARQHWAIGLLQPMTYALCQPWLKGYSGQNNAISGAGGGPTLLSFYPARFWVDQNLKKSMGQ